MDENISAKLILLDLKNPAVCVSLQFLFISYCVYLPNPIRRSRSRNRTSGVKPCIIPTHVYSCLLAQHHLFYISSNSPVCCTLFQQSAEISNSSIRRFISFMSITISRHAQIKQDHNGLNMHNSLSKNIIRKALQD